MDGAAATRQRDNATLSSCTQSVKVKLVCLAKSVKVKVSSLKFFAQFFTPQIEAATIAIPLNKSIDASDPPSRSGQPMGNTPPGNSRKRTRDQTARNGSPMRRTVNSRNPPQVPDPTHKRTLHDDEWIIQRGLPVTRPSWIAADLLADREDPEAVGQAITDALRGVMDYPGTFVETLGPHAAHLGLRRGDGVAVLRWLLDLVGDPETSRWMEEARAARLDITPPHLQQAAKA